MESLFNFTLVQRVLANDPNCNSDDEVILNLVKKVVKGIQNGLSVFRIDLHNFPDEDDCLQTCHATFLLKDQEGTHQWSNELRNGGRILLSDSVDALDQEIPVFISGGASLGYSCFISYCFSFRGSLVFSHLFGLNDLTFEEDTHFFDISFSG